MYPISKEDARYDGIRIERLTYHGPGRLHVRAISSTALTPETGYVSEEFLRDAKFDATVLAKNLGIECVELEFNGKKHDFQYGKYWTEIK